MLTCKKMFPEIPFAHRQWKHDGHCAKIHGHNWRFEIEFIAEHTDECGFVVDFGKLSFIRNRLAALDHTLVINRDDPHLKDFKKMVPQGLVDLVEVNDCSCEGLAAHFIGELDAMVQTVTNGRARIRSLTVWEDSKNSATITT